VKTLPRKTLLFKIVACKQLVGSLRAWSTSLLLLALLHSAPLLAQVLTQGEPLLQKIPSLTVVAQQRFTYQFKSIAIDEQQLRVRLLNKPAGATLTVLQDGSPVFEWTPPQHVQDETVVLVQAYDANNPEKISTQRMVLKRGQLETHTDVNTISSIDNDNAASQSLATDTIESAPSEVVVNDVATIDTVIKSISEEPTTPQHGNNKKRAPVLAKLGRQVLTVGTQFQLIIRPTDADDDELTLIAKRLPVGATLDAVFDGTWTLNWRPEVSQAGIHEVMLVTTEKTEAAKRTQRLLVMDVRDPNSQTRLVLASSRPGDDLVDEASQIGSAQPGPIGDATSVYFEPLSSQIVSAGRTINFPVVSHSEDNAETILHIDRLPSRASFDTNATGSRTFYWPTTPADQGEHIFRFTAVHPRDASQVAVKEVLIVIGDPAAPGSRPQSSASTRTLD